MSRIDHAVRDAIYRGLLVPVERDRVYVDAKLAWERANNLAAQLCMTFRIEALPDDRPDPSGDDDRICVGGER